MKLSSCELPSKKKKKLTRSPPAERTLPMRARAPLPTRPRAAPPRRGQCAASAPRCLEDSLLLLLDMTSYSADGAAAVARWCAETLVRQNGQWH
jgi:hypothetical protein